MKPTAYKTLSIIFGFTLLAILVYITFIGIRSAVRVLTALDSDIAVAIIAASATVLVSVISIVLGKAYEARALIQKEHREKKIPVYEDLFKFIFRILTGNRIGGAPSENEILEFMADFTQRIMVWGSDDVVAALVRWRRIALDEEELKNNPIKLLLLYEQLILAIRRDLGHRNTNLGTGDLLALFVNDIDDQLIEKQANSGPQPGGDRY